MLFYRQSDWCEWRWIIFVGIAIKSIQTEQSASSCSACDWRADWQGSTQISNIEVYILRSIWSDCGSDTNTLWPWNVVWTSCLIHGISWIQAQRTDQPLWIRNHWFASTSTWKEAVTKLRKQRIESQEWPTRNQKTAWASWPTWSALWLIQKKRLASSWDSSRCTCLSVNQGVLNWSIFFLNLSKFWGVLNLSNLILIFSEFLLFYFHNVSTLKL